MYYGHVSAMLYVSDLKRSVEYYRDELGFEFAGYWDNENHRVTDDYEAANKPGYASVQVGETKIGLHLDPEFVAGRRRVELHVPTEDADALYARLSQMDVDATQPQDQPWGARMFTVTDPDGHVWDFMEYLDTD